MTTNTHRVALVAALATLLLISPAFAASKITPNRAARFWNFTETAAEADRGARIERITRFTPNGADLGNFVLKLNASHRPIGFGANVFALSLAPLREFEIPLATGRTNLFTAFSFDAAMPYAGSAFSSTNQFIPFPSPNRVPGDPPPNTPEPGTLFGAALAGVAVLWLQRRRLVALLR